MLYPLRFHAGEVGIYPARLAVALILYWRCGEETDWFFTSTRSKCTISLRGGGSIFLMGGMAGGEEEEGEEDMEGADEGAGEAEIHDVVLSHSSGLGGWRWLQMPLFLSLHQRSGRSVMIPSTSITGASTPSIVHIFTSFPCLCMSSIKCLLRAGK